VFSALLAAFILLAACGSDPMPDTKTYYLGNSAAIEYPADWHADGEEGGVLLSPEPGGIWDTSPRPVFIAALGALSGADTDQMNRIKVGGKPAFRRSFDASESENAAVGFSGMKGWIIIVDTDGEQLQIIAMAPPIAWEDHKAIFEAMLSRMRFK
jgi:hypothetical protein